MAKIRAKLKQLRNADVRYISLVDRAASRIPFRVLKRDKENKMGIDLTKVFKSENTEKKPYVSALVVFAQKDEAAAAQVVEAIKAHGFTTDRVQKSDEGETLVFAQTEASDDITIVRLSDQLLVNVANLTAPNGWVGDVVKEQGFFPDLRTTTAKLYDQLEAVVKSDTPQEDANAALTSFAEYLNQIIVLPINSYKLDAAIGDIVKKAAKKPVEGSPEEEAEETPEEEDTEPPDEGDKKKKKAGEEHGEKLPPKLSTETEAERKKRIKDHPPAEMAPVDEDDDQKPPPEDVKKSEKPKVKPEGAPQKELLAELKNMTTQLTGLSQKLETVVIEQAAQKKTLDEVVRKADTLETTLKTTVSASPVSEDRPADSSRMRVQKVDDDPRRGNFDTAFLRRRK